MRMSDFTPPSPAWYNQQSPREDPSMPLTIACTSCGKQLRLPEAAAGQVCRCPSCHGTFTVVENAGRLSVQPSQPDIPEVLPVVLPPPRRGAEHGEPATVLPVAEPPG